MKGQCPLCEETMADNICMEVSEVWKKSFCRRSDIWKYETNQGMKLMRPKYRMKRYHSINAAWWTNHLNSLFRDQALNFHCSTSVGKLTSVRVIYNYRVVTQDMVTAIKIRSLKTCPVDVMNILCWCTNSGTLAALHSKMCAEVGAMIKPHLKHSAAPFVSLARANAST